MKNEPLLDLIQSLTMSEKRFFKIFSERHTIGEKNQYLQLFDFIDHHKLINNNILKNQPFVTNLSAEKNYLYRLLLKSLNVYYYEYSFKMKVQNYISNAEILAYKGLEKQAIKLLIKAEKIARNSELFSHLITIKQTQFEIYSKLNEYENALISLHELNEVSNNNEKLINTQNVTTKLYKKRQQQGGIRSQDNIKELESLISIINEKPSNSTKEQLYGISLLIVKFNSTKNFKQGLKEIKRIISLYETHPFLIEFSVKGYISSLYNLANTYRNLEEFDLAILTLDKLDSLNNHKLVLGSKFLKAYIFFLSNTLRLLIYIIKQDFKLAHNRFLSIKNEYPDRELSIEKQIYYEHLIIVTRILLEQKKYKEAIKYSNIIINDTSFKKREDMAGYIRLLNLIAHFELNNEFSLEYFSISTKNYLKRKKRLFKTEDLIIKFLINYNSNKVNSLKKIAAQLKKLKTDPLEKVMFSLFDFHNWIESKTTDKINILYKVR